MLRSQYITNRLFTRNRQPAGFGCWPYGRRGDISGRYSFTSNGRPITYVNKCHKPAFINRLVVRRLTKGGGGLRGRGLAVFYHLHVAFPHFPKDRLGLDSWPPGGPRAVRSLPAGRSDWVTRRVARNRGKDRQNRVSADRIVVQPGTPGPSH